MSFLVFSFFFGVCIYRSAEVRGRFWIGNKRLKKQTKQNTFSLKWEEKKGTAQAYFHLSIQSGLVCNGKMKLKSNIRIKILNDRYRPIDLYVFKKKQTKKQKQNKNNHVGLSVKISD